MEIILRDFDERDFQSVVAVFKDSSVSLRKSNGGKHPDSAVDKLVAGTDRRVFSNFAGKARLVVAQVRESGEIAGTGGIARSTPEKLLGSAFSTAHYVKRAYQGGRAGVSVGSMLRKATIEMARKEGCRRIYGYSTPEAIGFHKKFGAVFYPDNNLSYVDGIVPIHYYEIDIKDSLLNRLPIEVGICKFRKLGQWAVALRVMIFGSGKDNSLLYPIKSLYSWIELSFLLLTSKSEKRKSFGQEDGYGGNK
jgi:hypothetical protein